MASIYCSNLINVLDRELQSVADQVKAYPSDSELWHVVDGISNSGGTLALHLCGNLRHFVGAILGNSGYVRDRPAEFAGITISRDDVIKTVQDTRDEVRSAIKALVDSQLEMTYPVQIAGVEMTTGLFLLHLMSHLAYHLGQMDYHRRLVTGQNIPVGTVSIPKLIIT